MIYYLTLACFYGLFLILTKVIVLENDSKSLILQSVQIYFNFRAKNLLFEKYRKCVFLRDIFDDL